jgi:hypothetical protein
MTPDRQAGRGGEARATKVTIKHTPGLTFWATAVAPHGFGYDCHAALTPGKAGAGLNARSKAGRLRMVEGPPPPWEAKAPGGREPGSGVADHRAGAVGAGDPHRGSGAWCSAHDWPSLGHSSQNYGGHFRP